MRARTGLLFLIWALSVPALIWPELGIPGLFIVVAFPLAFIFWASPAITLISVIYYSLQTVLPYHGRFEFIIVLARCLLILTIPAMTINIIHWWEANKFTLEDHNDLNLPLQVKTIGVAKKNRFGGDMTACNSFCLHALLTGVAEKMLVIDNEFIDGPMPSETAIEFSFKKGPSCPAVKFAPGRQNLDLIPARLIKSLSVTAVEETKLRISYGDCLVSRVAKLGEADMVISVVQFDARKSKYYTRSMFSANKITVDRISVYVPSQTGFNEIYRRSAIWYNTIAWLLIPGPFAGDGFDMRIGWLDRNSRINPSEKTYGKPDWTSFLTKTLGFELKLDGVQTKNILLTKIEKALDENRAPSVQEWKAIDGYFKRIGIGGIKKLDGRSLNLVLRILESPRFPAPARLYTIGKYAALAHNDAAIQRMATALLNRIENGQTWPTEIGVSRKSSLTNLADGLNGLPDSAFGLHFTQHAKLASDPKIREHAYLSLRKLGAYGGQAVPTLVKLIDIGLRGGKEFFKINKYQRSYLAGMEGLCLAGENAGSALPRLIKLLREKKLPIYGSYGDLIITTLTRLGAESDALWTILSTANPYYRRQYFDSEVQRARSDRPDCDY